MQWLGTLPSISQRPDLDQLSADQLRALGTNLIDRAENKDRALVHCDVVIEKLNHEVAILKRHKFAKRTRALVGFSRFSSGGTLRCGSRPVKAK